MHRALLICALDMPWASRDLPLHDRRPAGRRARQLAHREIWAKHRATFILPVIAGVGYSVAWIASSGTIPCDSFFTTEISGDGATIAADVQTNPILTPGP
jgi:hypothetical protein